MQWVVTPHTITASGITLQLWECNVLTFMFIHALSVLRHSMSHSFFVVHAYYKYESKHKLLIQSTTTKCFHYAINELHLSMKLSLWQGGLFLWSMEGGQYRQNKN